MEPIKLRFTPTVSDYARVTRRLQLESARRPGAIVVWVLVAAAVVVVFALTSIDLLNFPLYAALPIIVVITLMALGPWIGAQQAGKTIKAAGEVTYDFTDKHLLIKDGTGKLKQEWSVYNGVVVTDEYYILVLTKNRNNSRFVPRRAFESPEQENAFRELLARKLNFKG